MNIKSRYSIQPINKNNYLNKNNYQTIQITSGSTLGVGYVYAPYVMAEHIDISDYEFFSKKQKNELRKKKLDSL